MNAVRRKGFAINNQDTQTGLTEVGMAIRRTDGRLAAGISLAILSVRFHKDRVDH